MEIEVVDADTQQHLPARLTIVDEDGALQSTGAASNHHLAVRPGIVFTSTGRARIGLPAGKYTIYAGRGFEYSLDATEVILAAGETVPQKKAPSGTSKNDGYLVETIPLGMKLQPGRCSSRSKGFRPGVGR